MSCDPYRLLLAFRADELAAEDRVALDSHLRECAGCAAKARADRAADAAIRKAMLNVPVPDGLRAKLHAAAAARQGEVWRRKAVRWAGGLTAAALLLVGGGWATFYLTRPEFSTTRLSAELEREQLQKEHAVSEWLTGQGLPAELPYSFEYGYHVFHGLAPVGGVDTPCIIFQNGTDQCRVYVLRKDSRAVPQDGWDDYHGSPFNIRTTERDGMVFVIAFTSQTLDPFLKPLGPVA